MSLAASQPSLLKASQIVVVGDAHGQLNYNDIQLLNEGRPDLVLFVGDLGSGSKKNSVELVRLLSHLAVPALVLPGNNDAAHLGAMLSELAHQAGRLQMREMMGQAAPDGDSCAVSIGTVGAARPGGYSHHLLDAGGRRISLVVARPCSHGGPELAYAEQLSRAYGISTMAESTARLTQLMCEAESDEILVLSHNGPLGLGGEPDSPFGRDFGRANGDGSLPLDWGDPDLADALTAAKSVGKRLLGIISGHMHRRREESRPFESVLDGVPVWNVARVPRIRSDEDGPIHHSVEVRIGAQDVTALERWQRPGS